MVTGDIPEKKKVNLPDTSANHYHRHHNHRHHHHHHRHHQRVKQYHEENIRKWYHDGSVYNDYHYERRKDTKEWYQDGSDYQLFREPKPEKMSLLKQIELLQQAIAGNSPQAESSYKSQKYQQRKRKLMRKLNGTSGGRGGLSSASNATNPVQKKTNPFKNWYFLAVGGVTDVYNENESISTDSVEIVAMDPIISSRNFTTYETWPYRNDTPKTSDSEHDCVPPPNYPLPVGRITGALIDYTNDTYPDLYDSELIVCGGGDVGTNEIRNMPHKKWTPINKECYGYDRKKRQWIKKHKPRGGDGAVTNPIDMASTVFGGEIANTVLNVTGPAYVITGGSTFGHDALPTRDSFNIKDKNIVKFQVQIPDALKRHCMVSLMRMSGYKYGLDIYIIGGIKEDRKPSTEIYYVVIPNTATNIWGVSTMLEEDFYDPMCVADNTNDITKRGIIVVGTLRRASGTKSVAYYFPYDESRDNHITTNEDMVTDLPPTLKGIRGGVLFFVPIDKENRTLFLAGGMLDSPDMVNEEYNFEVGEPRRRIYEIQRPEPGQPKTWKWKLRRDLVLRTPRAFFVGVLVDYYYLGCTRKDNGPVTKPNITHLIGDPD